MTSSFRAAVFAAALLLLPVATLQAGEVTRRVGSGESLSQICRDVYGDRSLYSLVALYNGKTDPTMVSVGETLRLPYSETVTLQKGESLSRLAKRVWGDPRMYPVLAWANGIRDPARVPAGTRLAVPVLVPYTLKRGESVSSVAGVFYGNPQVYEIILYASGIEDPRRVPAGALLKIPYVMPRPVVKESPGKTVRKEAPPPRPAPRPKEDPRRKDALALLTRAEELFRTGEYGDAWNAAHGAAQDLDGKELAKALRLQAASQYAFGKTDAALEDLAAAYRIDPDFRPDPAYVNPEMRELYEQAKNR